MVQLSKQEVSKNNPYLVKEAHIEAKELNERMQKCVKDDKNTYEALKELEEEPAKIENMLDVSKMVEHEFIIWDSFKKLKDEKESNETKEILMHKFEEQNSDTEVPPDFIEMYTTHVSKLKESKE